MDAVSVLIAENPVRQLWQMLRLYLDVAWVEGEVRRIHKLGVNEQRRNIAKQATQIGYCIRQAQEYWDASAGVGLATRPLLLYYGATSLSQALYLLKLDGSNSLDGQRRATKHNHHGLELARGAAGAIRPDAPLEAFFESLQATVYTKAVTPGAAEEGWGQFSLFYNSLLESECVSVPTHETVGSFASSVRGRLALPSIPKQPLAAVAGRPLKGYCLLNNLPDLYNLLSELGHATGLSPGSCQRNVFSSGPTDAMFLSGHLNFDLEGLDEDRSSLVKRYQQANPAIAVRERQHRYMHLWLEVKQRPGHQESMGQLPEMTTDTHGQLFYILRPNEWLAEPAAHFALLFCLGMLARYYPDVWMAVIDKNARVAEVTDAFLNVAYRKFPNLILDQMRGRLHVIQQGAWEK